MRTPTCFPAVDLVQLDLPFMSIPKRAEVVIEISKSGKLLAQLTCAYVAVIINHGGCLTSCAGKGPGSRPLKVRVLGAVMCGDRANIGHILNEALTCLIAGKHAIAVASCKLGSE